MRFHAASYGVDALKLYIKKNRDFCSSSIHPFISWNTKLQQYRAEPEEKAINSYRIYLEAINHLLNYWYWP